MNDIPGSHLLQHDHGRITEEYFPSQKQPAYSPALQVPTPAHNDDSLPSTSPVHKRARLTAQSLEQLDIELQCSGRSRRADDVDEQQDMVSDDETEISQGRMTPSMVFGKQLKARNIRHGFDNIHSPRDFDDIRLIMNRGRRSPSPDERRYSSYKTQLKTARTEDEVRHHVWKLLAKERPPNDSYRQNANIVWDALHTPLTTGMHAPAPHVCESYQNDSYPEIARTILGATLKPATQGTMAMPHFCMECKSPKGNLLSATQKSAYNGAVMVESARQVHDFIGRPPEDFDCKTQALTVAFNGINLDIYANHAVMGESPIQYNHAPITTDRPLFDLPSFKLSWLHVRNAQDWAHAFEKRKKEQLVAHEKKIHIVNAQNIIDAERRPSVAETEVQDIMETLERIDHATATADFPPDSAIESAAKSFARFPP